MHPPCAKDLDPCRRQDQSTKRCDPLTPTWLHRPKSHTCHPQISRSGAQTCAAKCALKNPISTISPLDCQHPRRHADSHDYPRRDAEPSSFTPELAAPANKPITPVALLFLTTIRTSASRQSPPQSRTGRQDDTPLPSSPRGPWHGRCRAGRQ